MKSVRLLLFVAFALVPMTPSASIAAMRHSYVSPIVTLYDFDTPDSGQDGRNPFAGLYLDPKTDALYGVTLYGGANNLGYVFELSLVPWSQLPPYAPERYITSFSYSFAGKGQGDGQYPKGNLIADPLGSGTLYGTTTEGGAYNQGTVFALVPNGLGSYNPPAIIYSFQGGADGQNPIAGVIADSGGALYGVTDHGGGSTVCPNGCGAVGSGSI